MFRLCVVVCAVISTVMANTQTFHAKPVHHGLNNDHIARQFIQSGSADNGFGIQANAGFGDTGFQAGGQFNAPNPANLVPGVNSNLLMTVVVGLGLLSLFNIIATLVAPFLNSSDEEVAEGERSGRSLNLAYLADSVLNAVESLAQKYE